MWLQSEANHNFPSDAKRQFSVDVYSVEKLDNKELKGMWKEAIIAI